MKKQSSKAQVQETINSFFKKDFSSEEMRKIRRLAMKYKIPLKEKRKLFCKTCLNPLKGKIRVTKTHKTVSCASCGHLNRFRMN